VVPVFYDPVLAKLIVWGQNREEARKRMILALKENIVLGVKTSIRFMIDCLEHPEYINGNTFTDFIEKNMSDKMLPEIADEKLKNAMMAAALHSSLNNRKKVVSAKNGDMPTPWQTIGKWEICSSNN
jgi:3-methylcrotonyl-CoA carboxylase alpha subunit